VRRLGMDEHAAADVFQTVFTRLLQQLPRIENPTRLQAWIVTTAKREGLLQRQRGQRNLSMTPLEGDDGESQAWDMADDGPLPEQQLDDLQQQHRVRSAMARMDERCRSLLELLFCDEDERLPYEAVAARMGMPVGSLGPTRARCLEKLRKIVTE
jgi:RNA polymerase sigma factor (sigma-70 family)